jgi:hypothetical protein
MKLVNLRGEVPGQDHLEVTSSMDALDLSRKASNPYQNATDVVSA